MESETNQSQNKKYDIMILRDVKKVNFVVDNLWSSFLRKHARVEGRVKNREAKY